MGRTRILSAEEIRAAEKRADENGLSYYLMMENAGKGCAAKIAAAVDAGMLGLQMFRSGNQFYGGDGIVKKGVENTIANVGKLARNGMRETDKEIIRLMLES